MKKIKKGDEVIVITGKDKGRRGVVTKVLDQDDLLIVEGINSAKKHTKPNPTKNETGGILIIQKPIHKSNVMLYDQASSKGSRVKIKVLEDGNRIRCFQGTNEAVDV